MPVITLYVDHYNLANPDVFVTPANVVGAPEATPACTNKVAGTAIEKKVLQVWFANAGIPVGSTINYVGLNCKCSLRRLGAGGGNGAVGVELTKTGLDAISETGSDDAFQTCATTNWSFNDTEITPFMSVAELNDNTSYSVYCFVENNKLNDQYRGYIDAARLIIDYTPPAPPAVGGQQIDGLVCIVC